MSRTGKTRLSSTVSALNLCPGCSSDGGYGMALPGVEYQCPRCRAPWFYSHELAASTAPQRGALSWWERLKVWATS